MPNTISQQELEDLRLPELARSVRLVRAGGIRPYAFGGACHAQIEDVVGCVVYAQVVGWHVKKFGTTYSLRDRMEGNRDTINAILAFQDGRSTSQAQWLKDLARGKGDQFKKRLG